MVLQCLITNDVPEMYVIKLLLTSKTIMWPLKDCCVNLRYDSLKVVKIYRMWVCLQ